MLFLGVLNFGVNRLHILIYTALIALIITSVLVLALPYSMIGRQVSKKIIFVMFGEMAILIPLWLLISQRIYFRFCPPVKTIFITDLPTEDWVVDVVNLFSKRYTIVDTVSPRASKLPRRSKACRQSLSAASSTRTNSVYYVYALHTTKASSCARNIRTL